MMWDGTLGIFFGNILVSSGVLVKNAKGQKRAKKNKGSVPSMVKFKQRFFIVEEKMPRVKFLMFCLCFY